MTAAAVLPMNLDESRRQSFERASEWAARAAEVEHIRLEQRILDARRRGGTWVWGVLARMRTHVRTSPACPRCKQILRRERLRDTRMWGAR